MAEKNIAYLVREDVKTIGVRFYFNKNNKAQPAFNLNYSPEDIDALLNELSPKQYTYVTNLDFKVGDLAVVRAAGEIKVAYVSRVDEGCEIEPNQTIKFSWVIDRVDTDEYEKQLEINKELEDTVNKAYKQSVKNQFRQLVMGSIDVESAARINMLLGITPKEK